MRDPKRDSERDQKPSCSESKLVNAICYVGLPVRIQDGVRPHCRRSCIQDNVFFRISVIICTRRGHCFYIYLVRPRPRWVATAVMVIRIRLCRLFFSLTRVVCVACIMFTLG